MSTMFELELPFWELLVRATIVYLALLILVRAVPKRNAGHISPNDLLTLIVIGTIATDGMMGGSTSIGDILLMIAIILGWSYALDRLEYKVPALRGLLRAHPTRLVEDGRLLRRNMRHEMVTEQELMSVLRKEGVDDLARVRLACMEADGEISVIVADSAPER